MVYKAAEKRYDTMRYNRCGRSGLKLPAISLGLWHNFGGVDTLENGREMLLRAFDLGISHFDLANNYGPPPGSAEENFGRILKQDLRPYRDQSLKRMGLEYVDIFYSHRPDPETPLEETMSALDYAVRSGRTLYVGISSYDAQQTRQAVHILHGLGTPCLIHQPVYNLLNRWVEPELMGVLAEEGVGCIAFSPLAQGLLTDRYLAGIPQGSRASKPHGFLRPEDIQPPELEKVRKLSEIAKARGQKMVQLALAWILRLPGMTSVLIGASRVQQVEECVGSLDNLEFSQEELAAIDRILAGG
jgi:L-glyceraldehyde 3-phosphate reductase